MVAPVFGTNCYVVADGGECVVIDAGAGVADEVGALVRDRALAVRSVLATHGHVDHTWDAAVLTQGWGVPLRLHAADAYRLADPFGTLGLGGASHDARGPLAQALAEAGLPPTSYRVPSEVATFDGDRAELVLGGLTVTALHAPGHTQGSTLYLLDGGDGPVALTGDVLFAGTIGRTDLPGGDGPTMARTLRDVVSRLDPATRVLPGHGPSSTVATELVRNPFLAGGAVG